jgi:4-amino-4-deoxy-L-arabinose transferase-like glycosyltransferase
VKFIRQISAFEKGTGFADTLCDLPQEISHRQDNRSRFFAFFLIIIGLALILRVFHISSQPLWVDEAASWHKVTDPTWLQKRALGENTPPLYYLMLRMWIGVAGQSEAGLRSLSALLGTLFVAALMWFGRTILSSEIALWGGLFAALSPIHIYYSQEARAYALLILMLLLVYGALWRALEANTTRSWLFFSVTTLAALYSHYSAILGLIPTLFLILVWPLHMDGGKRWYHYAVSSLLSLGLFLPWMLGRTFLTARPVIKEEAWVNEVWKIIPPHLAIPKSLAIFGLGSEAQFVPIALKQFSHLQFPVAFRIMGLAALMVLGILLVSPWGDRRLRIPWLGRRKAWLGRRKAWLGVTVLFPLAALWLLSFFRPAYLPGRYDMAAYSCFPLLLGLTIAKARHVSKLGLCLVTVPLTCILLASATKLVLYYRAEPVDLERPQATARVIDEFAKSGDVVVFTGLTFLPVIFYLTRIGYAWNQGYCDNPSTGQHFACRTFPRETEEHPAIFDGSRILRSVEEVRADIQELLGKLEGPDASLWLLVSKTPESSDLWMTLPRLDILLLSELTRLGFHAILIPGSAAPGVLHLTRSS